ncbi:hypothetical protein [Streptomyces vinaceus]|uniref:hypothetical protein n=1 Tax=Streptomyces vinaceus TaxID=1960 RepID=UPI0035D52EC9
MGTGLAGAVVVTVLPVAAPAGVLSMPVLYAVALVLGAVAVLHRAAAIAIVPQLVAPALLHRADARVGAAFGAADTAGNLPRHRGRRGRRRGRGLLAGLPVVPGIRLLRGQEPGRPVPAAGGDGPCAGWPG